MAADEEKKQGDGEPEVNMVAVNLADIADDDDEIVDEPEAEPEQAEVEEAEQAEEEKKEPAGKAAGDMSGLLDDIFADEVDENERLKSFGDLEHLTMVEVMSEVEAVLEELRIRQGGHE